MKRELIPVFLTKLFRLRPYQETQKDYDSRPPGENNWSKSGRLELMNAGNLMRLKPFTEKTKSAK